MKTPPILPLPDASRRGFLTASTLALTALALGCTRSSSAAPSRPAVAGKVTLVEFSNDGKPLRTLVVDRIVKTEADWRRQLSPLSFEVTRHSDTERAFSGALLNEHAHGVFRCICCDTALFDSHAKFDSGTGWPSFWQAIAKQNVAERSDNTFGMTRTAVSCARCDAHLGHVFDDGPKPTGLRYCMNSAALRFTKA